MKYISSLLILALVVFATSALAGTMINYTYDAQYRLTQVSTANRTRSSSTTMPPAIWICTWRSRIQRI